MIRAKPRIWWRIDEWCCIVRGDSRSRMGTGATPLAAYRSWEFYRTPVGEVVARAVHAESAPAQEGKTTP